MQGWQKLLPLMLAVAGCIFLCFVPSAIAAGLVAISNVSDSPDPFSPDNDNSNDSTVFSALISLSSFGSKTPLRTTCTLEIFTSSGASVALFTQSLLIPDNSSAVFSQVWDGKTAIGALVPPGIYTYRLDASAKKINAVPVFGNVTVERATLDVLSVSVTPDSWAIGSAVPGAVITMSNKQKITVTNDGTVATTYALNLIDPRGWTASGAAVGTDIYILNAAFGSNPTKIAWQDARHALSPVPVRCTEIQFAGTETGVGVLPGSVRTLYLQFKAPTQSSVSTQQSIEVVISAQAQ